MVAPVFSSYDGASHEDHFVTIQSATWQDYERLLDLRGESAVPRYTYLEGVLEIMSPSRTHESVKSMIGRLVEVWCLRNGIEFHTLGSWTLKERALERGLEPDECYIFGPSGEGTRPDLAIEVVWTSGGINKLEVYRKLGVAEVWYWSRGTIAVYRLSGEQYVEVPDSQALPRIDLHQLGRFIDSPSTSRAIVGYREALASREPSDG